MNYLWMESDIGNAPVWPNWVIFEIFLQKQPEYLAPILEKSLLSKNFHSQFLGNSWKNVLLLFKHLVTLQRANVMVKFCHIKIFLEPGRSRQVCFQRLQRREWSHGWQDDVQHRLWDVLRPRAGSGHLCHQMQPEPSVREHWHVRWNGLSSVTNVWSLDGLCKGKLAYETRG